MKVAPIHLQVNGDPVFLKRRVVPYGLREPVKKEIDNLVSDGIIFPVEQSHWETPIVTPLKSSDQPSLQTSRYTTINTPFGLFQYNFLPIGLSISAEIFQSTINSVLQDLLGVKAYQDDIIVYGDSKSTHDLCLLK